MYYARYTRIIHSRHCCNLYLLHFAWGVAEAKCIVVTAVCVSAYLSLAAFPHYCANSDVIWGMVRGALSALLGGFAVAARFLLLWQHSAEREMSASACTCCMPGYIKRAKLRRQPYKIWLLEKDLSTLTRHLFPLAEFRVNEWMACSSPQLNALPVCRVTLFGESSA